MARAIRGGGRDRKRGRGAGPASRELVGVCLRRAEPELSCRRGPPRAGAIALIEAPRSEFPVLGRANTGTSWGLAAAAIEAYTVLDKVEQAAALYDTIVELGTTASLMRSWDYRLIATLQGMSAACGRDWDRAEAHFEDALWLARGLPMRLEEPEACRFYGQMLVARDRPGDPD